MVWESCGEELQFAGNLVHQICLTRCACQVHRLLGALPGVAKSSGFGVGGGERVEDDRVLSASKLVRLLRQFHGLLTVAQ